jgi:two-component system sensor histidine kinase PilS (NtrC family)
MAPPEQAREFVRLWRGFMTARAMLGLMLLLFQLTLYVLGQSSRPLPVALCAAYFAAALSARLLSRPHPLGRHFDLPWAAVIGVDIVVFTLLQWLQAGNINYTPLLALPVLLASVLGSLRLALGTAAGVTLLLLGHAAWLAVRLPADVAPLYIEAALTSAGYFAIAVLAHQLSARLASEEQRAQRNQLAARIQQQVNALVIESLSEGILVVSAQGTVHAANPAARQLLQAQDGPLPAAPFELTAEPGWRALAELAQRSHQRQAAQQADITLQHPAQGPRRIHVRTRLTPPMGAHDGSLCVLFLQDQREMQARLRTEKLASMGRMSAAVAHEIRNPLAAISQANALLDEDLADPRHKQLTRMVRQNARRLEKIVEDILELSRVPSPAPSAAPLIASLDATVAEICADWSAQNPGHDILRTELHTAPQGASFEPEHLRRVLVNLLDNARRHASARPGAIQLSTRVAGNELVTLAVWSDSAPMEPSVEQHLFEPFFSSESRSSGLGLYLCRERCERHGAVIGHRRAPREVAGARVEGNEFFVSLRPTAANTGAAHHPPPVTPWH